LTGVLGYAGFVALFPPRASLPGTSELFSISTSQQTRVRPGWLAQPERKADPKELPTRMKDVLLKALILR